MRYDVLIEWFGGSFDRVVLSPRRIDVDSLELKVT